MDWLAIFHSQHPNLTAEPNEHNLSLLFKSEKPKVSRVAQVIVPPLESPSKDESAQKPRRLHRPISPLEVTPDILSADSLV